MYAYMRARADSRISTSVSRKPSGEDDLNVCGNILRYADKPARDAGL